MRCETRFAGFDGEVRFPRFRIQAIVAGRVIASLELVEVLFPKGPLGSAPPLERRAFLRDRRPVAGLRLSREENGATRLDDAAVRASDWLPGTLAQAYAAEGDLPTQIAAKEHVAARAAVHPAIVTIDPGAAGARADTQGAGSTLAVAHSPSEPFAAWPIAIERTAGAVRVSDAGPPSLDLAPVRDWWDGTTGSDAGPSRMSTSAWPGASCAACGSRTPRGSPRCAAGACSTWPTTRSASSRSSSR